MKTHNYVIENRNDTFLYLVKKNKLYLWFVLNSTNWYNINIFEPILSLDLLTNINNNHLTF